MATTTLKYFAYAHLPAHLQAVSKPIGQLAEKLEAELPDGPEKSAGMRKLLEAKDCFVRARLDVPPQEHPTTPAPQDNAAAVSIKKMVDRFLGWKLPEDFFPDCYVSFDREKASATGQWPVGTNLLTATQAEQLFRHCLGDVPAEPPAIALAPHQQRVVDEKAELDDRLQKLDAFIKGNQLFATLEPEEQLRMVRQANAMTTYSEVLAERIAAFN